MIEIRIGDLRHRLTLEQVVREDDGCGGAIENWQQIEELWSAIRPVGGQEREFADQLAGRVTHEIWVRYRTNVKPDMRFRNSSRIFTVRAVIDSRERRRFLRCLAEELDL